MSLEASRAFCDAVRKAISEAYKAGLSKADVVDKLEALTNQATFSAQQRYAPTLASAAPEKPKRSYADLVKAIRNVL
jgi:hypothetical protein